MFKKASNARIVEVELSEDWALVLEGLCNDTNRRLAQLGCAALPKRRVAGAALAAFLVQYEEECWGARIIGDNSGY